MGSPLTSDATGFCQAGDFYGCFYSVRGSSVRSLTRSLASFILSRYRDSTLEREHRLGRARNTPLVIQQPLFSPPPAAVSDQLTVGTNHPVARNHQGQRVSSVSAPDCPHCSRAIKPTRQIRIRPSLTRWNLPQQFPNAPLKSGTNHHQRDRELYCLSVEIIT